MTPADAEKLTKLLKLYDETLSRRPTDELESRIIAQLRAAHARLRAAAQTVLDSHLHEGVDGIVNATRKAMGALAAELEGGSDA